ncbi:MurR/RpiR family transcriptional regulator [Pannonibacter tanglangensis]|uniref:SIS domain-containing protein n=1 Tax=Pannonibacter tanglangensis TaxID=2750084 RepID=A0ABW9ZEL9_9HYPH|nr:MurR/RpiR family transcriptional regulator [Pannonibacter sp. XCT-34]NBN63146.1 SIS domain-containing protein [Pannonibacter sp. XCT-34]
MKNKSSSPKASWTAQSDHRFTQSELGRKVSQLLETGSRSQQALSEFILRDPIFVATHGIEELARRSGISPSTISRYVRDLGLESFAEFRAGVGETVHALIAPVTKLGDRLAQPDDGETVADTALRAAALMLQGLADADTAARIRKVSAEVKAARTVWVMGFGLSAHLAAMLALGLQPYRDNVINVVQFGGTEVAAGRLMSAADGDVLIAITFPRYSAEVVALAQAAKLQGVRIVALTDSPAAPLARMADEVLLAPAQHPILSSSSLPGLALIEALVSEFLMSDPSHVERAARLAAAMAAYLAGQD